MKFIEASWKLQDSLVSESKKLYSKNKKTIHKILLNVGYVGQFFFVFWFFSHHWTEIWSYSVPIGPFVCASMWILGVFFGEKLRDGIQGLNNVFGHDNES